VGFYALGIIVPLYYALSDSKMDPEDPDVPHIYISLDAALLFAGYLSYLAVCANMNMILISYTLLKY
jgi:hypothetical protein